VPVRLAVVAHGPTASTSKAAFGGDDQLIRPKAIKQLRERVACWVSAPEPACLLTAAQLGGDPQVLDGLRGCDFGSWSGRMLSEVRDADPNGLAEWLEDSAAAPHGGESLLQLIGRVGAVLDDLAWPEGLSVAVVSPLVARAIAVHALSLPAKSIFRLDVGPLGRVLISRAALGWRLQALDRRLNSAGGK
jgi:broad specificity phosphatase PhoE